MNIKALLVVNCGSGASKDPIILAKAIHPNLSNYFHRSSVKELIAIVCERTPSGQRKSVQLEDYKVHAYNRNAICAIGFMDNTYPHRIVFSILNQVLDEYHMMNHGDHQRYTQSWPYLNEILMRFQDPAAQADGKLLRMQKDLEETRKSLHSSVAKIVSRGEKMDYLVERTNSFGEHSKVMFRKKAKKQDFVEADDEDKLVKIQRELDETKKIALTTVDKILARGERLESLVNKTANLGATTMMFHKQAKKRHSCCTIL